MCRNVHKLTGLFKLNSICQDYYTRNLTLQCFQESSRIPVLKTMFMRAKHVLYVRPLLETLKAGIENINTLIKNLLRLLGKNLVSFMQVSTVVTIRLRSISMIYLGKAPFKKCVSLSSTAHFISSSRVNFFYFLRSFFMFILINIAPFGINSMAYRSCHIS